MKNFELRIVAQSALILLLVASCATNPVTGRKQLNLVSADQEMQLGLTSFEKMKKEVPISHDAAANALVQKVGKRIASVAELPNAKWEFVVFDSKEANAFCLPGGKVGVYTGLLPISKDEDGLATVIGHEVAHAVSHHGAERMSEGMALQVGGQLLGAATQSAKPITQTAVAAVYGLGGKLGYELPHSRKQESEADHIGLIYMARAGYNPEAAVDFWQRFSSFNEAHGGSKTPNFLRTHPVDEKRIQQIKDWLPEAKAQMRNASGKAPNDSGVIGRKK
ncbi:MAG: M48 family metallopeptidase [Verrucomicrobiota bacterium]|nr:M48 family metallopeptidase [Verrucomicrobiota bacterium]